MLNHKGTQTIHTERLTLRRFTLDDAQTMFDTWANDERVTRFLTWTPHGTPELTRMIVESWCSDYANADTYNWAIELNGRIIGSIGVVDINERSEYAHMGYCIAYDHWGKGIVSEAAQAVTDFLFSEVGLHRICIRHATQNPASGRVAQKCGLTYEGTGRQLFKAAWGEYLDIAFYGILKSEWKQQRAEKCCG